MALLPTTHLRTTSLSGLHRPHIPFLFLRRHCSIIARNGPPFDSILAQSPQPPLHPRPAQVLHSSAYSSLDCRWLDNWKNDDHMRKLPKRPRATVDYRGTDVYDDEYEVGTSRSTGGSTMEKIVEKLKKFGYVDGIGERKERPLPERGSVKDVFYAEDGVLPNSRGGLLSDSDEEVRFPWEKPRFPFGDGEGAERRKPSKTSLAELTLPEGELRRLRDLAIRTKSKMKIGGTGVTKEIVDKIHERWMTEEVVRLKCEGPAALNMKRMHEILERKTGGLVIWRSGSSISLYRGVNYELSQPVNNWNSNVNGVHTISKGAASKLIDHSTESSYIHKVHTLKQDEGTLVKQTKHPDPSDMKYEHEIDKLLDNLGPRYMDWAGCEPLPVDADMLPGVVPGYMPPFRILPYGLRAHLGMKDQTRLRRLARVLPPHFALGRSRQHQGLAAAMIKLWEKSSIAKIALKRGVQLTSSERMAEDIKKLTGGTLLCRNKDYIVFYRGKDFLTPEVSEVLVEREKLAKRLQDEEEKARLKASFAFSNTEMGYEPRTAGTLGETQDADARWAKKLDNDHESKIMRAADMARHADLVRKLERKLFLAQNKLLKAERALGKVEEFLKPTEHKPDLEYISEEERFMFRKLGLKMKAFLLLGRRGVFDGTVENMHLHWKYRELVKIIVKAKTFAQVRTVALSLEAESGGVLVSVDKISKGFAIVVYRGKDYQRPATLRPKNLLTKRKALARSIELQRREALCHHISNLEKRVEKLRCELEQMEAVKELGDKELYDKLDSVCLSDDENPEDVGDEAYFEALLNDAEDRTSGDDESEGNCDSTTVER